MKGNILNEERDNRYIDHFLAGVYKSGTIFSHMRFYGNIEKIVRGVPFTDNPLRLRGVELAGVLEIGMRDSAQLSDIPDVFCYLAGMVAGFAAAPVDFAFTVGAAARDYYKSREMLASVLGK